MSSSRTPFAPAPSAETLQQRVQALRERVLAESDDGGDLDQRLLELRLRAIGIVRPSSAVEAQRPTPTSDVTVIS